MERLSGLVEACSESLTIDSEERVRVINSTVSIESRILKFFDMIEVGSRILYGTVRTSRSSTMHDRMPYTVHLGQGEGSAVCPPAVLLAAASTPTQ